MKIRYFFLLILLLSLGCAAQQEVLYTKITYTASSRGLYEDIELTKQKISVNKERSSEKRTEISMPKREWAAILKLCKELPKSVETLNQDKLAVDAAIKGVLILKINGKPVEGLTYVLDHSNVPEEIRPLLDKIHALAHTVE